MNKFIRNYYKISLCSNSSLNVYAEEYKIDSEQWTHQNTHQFYVYVYLNCFTQIHMPFIYQLNYITYQNTLHNSVISQTFLPIEFNCLRKTKKQCKIINMIISNEETCRMSNCVGAPTKYYVRSFVDSDDFWVASRVRGSTGDA